MELLNADIIKMNRVTSKQTPLYTVDIITFGLAATRWLKDAGVNFDKCTVKSFLNRLLGIATVPQRMIFDCFARILERTIRDAKKLQGNDRNILCMYSVCI